MPDYIYLLENRLSADQRNALTRLRDAAREAGMILFLTGDAVRDLTSGHAVRELEVAVHGNALKLKKTLEKSGASVWGEDETSRSLYLCFPGTVRVDVVSTHRVEYPKPGKAVFHPASIQEDLRRRDFTVNAMALSLNEGSFGLLMDPLNGAADIEARTLRLVSNYGFLEDSSLLIRATRYKARLGWDLDPRSQTRYENAKLEDVIDQISAHARSRELEQIGHEEEGLKVLRALEEEGWMKVLYPAWTSAKADEPKLKALHELAVELLMQGVHADMSAAQMQLLTSGMSSKDLAGLKKSLLRPGFVEEWNSLDELASGFQKVLLAKQNVTPSATYKLFVSYDPEAVLWLGFTSKNAAVRERYDQFLKVWPEARLRIPYPLLQEMRITQELANYKQIVEGIFLELIDGKLTTPEEMRAYLEPFSPPAPPPQVPIKRTRRRAEAKLKELEEEEEEAEEGLEGEEEIEELGGDEEDSDLVLALPKSVLENDEEIEGEEESEEEAEDSEPAPKRPDRKPAEEKGKKSKSEAKKAAPRVAERPAKAAKPPAKPEAKVKPAPAKAAPKAKAVEKAKPAPARKSAPVSISGKGGKPGKPAPKPAPAKAKPAHAGNGKNSHPAKPGKPAAKKAARKR